jgi:hypothetical protein
MRIETRQNVGAKSIGKNATELSGRRRRKY